MILALAVVSALPCLSSCATRWEYVRPPVPSALLEPCQSPELTGDTWADVARLALRQGQALAECSARIQAIRGIVRDDGTPATEAVKKD